MRDSSARSRNLVRLFSACVSASIISLSQADDQSTVAVAHFAPTGELIKPKDLDKWVFMGTSMGMGYNQAAFKADSPGQFNVVLMEPSAYAYFKANGKYADGTMFLLSFYGTDQKLSIARSGFVQGDLGSYEIHLIDRQNAEGHRFFPFAVAATQSRALAAGNDCVKCHMKDGAYDGTFAQFYPAIRKDIPKEALQKALEKSEK